MTGRTLVDLLGDECRRSEARSRVLFALGVAIRKLDDAEDNAIRDADAAISQSRQLLAAVPTSRRKAVSP
jgi:hypothetical protein